LSLDIRKDIGIMFERNWKFIRKIILFII